MKADLATLLGAVKPSKRTDKYVVLAAMYELRAHQAPTTASRISDLLKLHLRTKAPRNVPDGLRKYGAVVKPVAKGPPLLWALTGQGLAYLSKSSGLELAESAAEQQFESDIGLICALEHPEMAAVVSSLGGESAWQQIGDSYLSTGASRFTHEQLRQTCEHYRAYDGPNFAKHLKRFGSELGGSKESGYTLTQKGLAAATVLLKQIVGKDESR